MDKKTAFKDFVSGAGSKAKDLFDKAVMAVDQNDDGRFDLTDVSAIAGTVENSVKQSAQTMRDNAKERARLYELKTLQPIFIDSLADVDFSMPKFIRITDRDKKRAESEVCQGSIGYNSSPEGLPMVNIFRDSIDSFGLIFYPDCDYEFYYVDPCDRDRYIALDEYFNYLKVARVSELQKLAQDLGAKYFKITYKEEQASFSSKKVKASAQAKSVSSANVDHNSSVKKYSTIEIAAEMSFPGHAPITPQLKYMHRDPSIQSLIAMRMDETAPLLKQKYMLKMSISSGMKESDAVKIDAVLKGLKCTGNTTVASEAQNEARRYFEYDIEF